MKIVLRIDGVDKEFLTDFIPGRIFRQAVKARELLKKGNELTDEELDELIMVVVNAYNKQFTIDQFWDGIDARDIMDTIVDTIIGTIQRVNGTGGSEDTQ